MRSDEEAAGHAYYIRLAKLLRCELSNNYPVGFDPTVFESLWLFVRSWLANRTGAHLIVPTPEYAGFRRYVALPLSHVPLRCLDIEKLPDFFFWAGYEPGSRVPLEKLESDLVRWDGSRSALTPTGAAALRDNRRSAVLAQVASELESWDGSIIESLNRRSAIVEIMLDVVQRRIDLFYLPRRPAGFPKIFDDGSRVFESAEDGWYDPVVIESQDGPLLANGFEWCATVDGIQAVLRRPESRLVTLTPSEYSGLLSHSGLLRGVRCAVLCQDNLAEPVGEYLSEITRQLCRPITDSRIPVGWRLFINAVPQRSVDPPVGLEALEVNADVGLVLSGGLRLNRRWAWVVGAPPQILVAGLEPGDHAAIDNMPVDVSADGVLEAQDMLSQPGVHIVEAGRMRRRIEVVEPSIESMRGSISTDESRGESISVVALPSGSWTLVGRTPVEFARTQSQHRSGVLAKCAFTPVWAIQVGAGPGATVAALELIGPEDSFSTRKRSPRGVRQLEAWASVIYDAHVRRPRFLEVRRDLASDEVIKAWKQYVEEAKRIKRALAN
ncbi:MAG: hypothetical protein HY646_12455 [Acidobacteria bacterium]|nr:hypothetical protein [Acidobacteriota bacterium]